MVAKLFAEGVKVQVVIGKVVIQIFFDLRPGVTFLQTFLFFLHLRQIGEGIKQHTLRAKIVVRCVHLDGVLPEGF